MAGVRNQNALDRRLVITVALSLLVGFVCGFCASGVAHRMRKSDIVLSMASNVYCLKYGKPDAMLWAHRCDSVGKVKRQMRTFKGVELDLNFHKGEGKFDVSHDMQESIEYPLEDFLAILGKSDTKMWLDYKNLDEEDASVSLVELNRLFALNHIDKSRAIVESPRWDLLGSFRDDGWYTSFYCPYGDYETDDEKEAFCSKVRTAASSNNVDAVSFDVMYYELVKLCNVSVDMLTWYCDSHWWSYYRGKRAGAKELMDDEQLKVILVGAEYDKDSR